MVGEGEGVVDLGAVVVLARIGDAGEVCDEVEGEFRLSASYYI